MGTVPHIPLHHTPFTQNYPLELLFPLRAAPFTSTNALIKCPQDTLPPSPTGFLRRGPPSSHWTPPCLAFLGRALVFFPGFWTTVLLLSALPFGASVLLSLPSLGNPTQLGTGDPVKNLFALQLPSMQAPRGSSHPALSPGELTHAQGFSCLLEAVDPQIYTAHGSSGLACPTAS